MAPTFPPGFTLSEISPSDIDEVFSVLEKAYYNDPTWAPVRGSATPEDIHKWLMMILGARYQFPDITIWKITEDATGRIVAWTALQFPWKERPISEEQKAVVNSHDLPPLVEGMNSEALPQFLMSLSFAALHGYDMETDYHRKGTMVHPDFQKRGFATALTKHANAFADKTGGRTFAPARPTSIKMFNDNGFVTVGTYDSELERWGGTREKSITFMVIREAPVAV